MPSPAQALEAVYARFQANWTATTVYHLDGEGDFTRPTADPDNLSAAEWARVSFRDIGSDISLGSQGRKKYTRDALIFVQVFVPLGQGRKRVTELATTARDIFEDQRFSGVFCYAGNIRQEDQEDGWLAALAEIACSYEEVR